METTVSWGWDLFGLGILGAFLTVYLAKQEIIPKFPSIFFTSKEIGKVEIRRDELQKHVEKTEKELDEKDAKMLKSTDEKEIAKLNQSIKRNQIELEKEREEISRLGGELKQNKIITTGLGFFFYIILGGVFGSLLTNIVEVKALGTEVPKYFESIVIGSGWITFLSVIGLNLGKKKVDEKIEELRDNVAAEMKKSRKENIKLLKDEVEKVEEVKLLKLEKIEELRDNVAAEMKKSRKETEKLLKDEVEKVKSKELEKAEDVDFDTIIKNINAKNKETEKLLKDEVEKVEEVKKAEDVDFDTIIKNINAKNKETEKGIETLMEQSRKMTQEDLKGIL